jgi:hypothetical protein
MGEANATSVDRPFPRRRIVVEALAVLAGVLLLVWAWRADRAWFEHYFFWRYCAVDAREVSFVRIARWAAAGAGVALIFGLRPRLGRWATRRGARAVVGGPARVVAAALLALLLAEGALRRSGWKPRVPHPLATPDQRGDAWYGWMHEPSRVQTLSYGTKQVTYVIDADGNRVLAPDPPVDKSGPTLVFAGESITLGLGRDYAETYPALVEQRLGIPSVNLSVTGYGNDQVYLRMRDELTRLARPLAVVTLVVPVQLVRNVEPFRAHHVPRDDGSFEEVSAQPAWWTGSPLRLLLDRLVGLHSDEAVLVARATLRATARDARARGAFPLFVMTNWGPACLPDESGAPPLERALFDGLDVEHVRVDLPRDWWEEEIDHPSARAHVAIADAIVEALRARGVVGAAR